MKEDVLRKVVYREGEEEKAQRRAKRRQALAARERGGADHATFTARGQTRGMGTCVAPGHAQGLGSASEDRQKLATLKREQ